MSEGLIYPSFQEGFGWPVLEAQACGCAVFASNRAPMTELGAEAALYFDPADTDAAAAFVVGSLGERPRMQAEGLENVKRFTVETMIEQYVAAYRKVAKG